MDELPLSPTPCSHTYQYMSVVWRAGSQMPGSGAHERIYSDRFYCTRCLHTRDINDRVLGNTYSKPIEGSVPA